MKTKSLAEGVALYKRCLKRSAKAKTRFWKRAWMMEAVGWRKGIERAYREQAEAALHG